MPVFYRISFDADELEALRKACASRSSFEDYLLDEAAGGDLEGAVLQESRADDMLLIKSTVSIFKPGQTILITKEDLNVLKKNLENYKEEAPTAALQPAERAIKKIDSSLERPAQ